MATDPVPPPSAEDAAYAALLNPAANPPEGIFFRFSLRLPPTFKPRQVVAYGSREQYEAEILPAFTTVAWEFGERLVGLPLRFPHCALAYRDVADVDGPHDRTIAQIEREFGPLPPPTLEDPEF